MCQRFNYLPMLIRWSNVHAPSSCSNILSLFSLSFCCTATFEDNSSILLSFGEKKKNCCLPCRTALRTADSYLCACAYIWNFLVCVCAFLHHVFISHSLWYSIELVCVCTHSIIKMSLIQRQPNDLMANAKPITCNIIQSLCLSLSLFVLKLLSM